MFVDVAWFLVACITIMVQTVIMFQVCRRRPCAEICSSFVVPNCGINVLAAALAPKSLPFPRTTFVYTYICL